MLLLLCSPPCETRAALQRRHHKPTSEVAADLVDGFRNLRISVSRKSAPQNHMLNAPPELLAPPLLLPLLLPPMFAGVLVGAVLTVSVAWSLVTKPTRLETTTV